MRTLPPPHELVQKGAPVRGLSGEDDDDLVIVLPGEPAPQDPAAEAGPDDGDRAEADDEP